MRKLAYWTQDQLRGGRVRRHLADLDRAFADPDAVQGQTKARLQRLLHHACDTTDYYRPYKGIRNLDEFPILHRRIAKERPQELMSSSYERPALIPVTSSGSYGAPTTHYLTRGKMARRTAEIIYFSRWAGYEIGARHAYVRLPANSSRLTLFMQNQTAMEPRVLDKAWLEEQRQVLLKAKIQTIIGYASALGALAEYCLRQKEPCNAYGLQSVIPMAEPLAEGHRQALKAAFGCQVMSRYSTMEMGVLAQQCPCEQGFHLNTTSYVIEMLSLDGDKPTAPGEAGRVVVTDLFSHGMPLIRYDLGDVAILGQECACGRPGPTLERIEGKVLEEVTRTNGQRLSPHAISMLNRNPEGVLQYQFAQVGERAYELRLCTFGSFNRGAKLYQDLKAVLGADAQVRIKYVEQIQPLPSGKRPMVVNEWRQQKEQRAGLR